MSRFEGKRCDIFPDGTVINVKVVRVTVELQGSDGEWADAHWNTADMSLRARQRLNKFIKRGFTRPVPKEVSEPDPLGL